MSAAERAAELAAAFASGDLDAAGQGELLGLLQHPVDGPATAAAAWREIDTAAALRAVEPAVFIGQVALRMGEDGKAVARAVAVRIGAPAPAIAPLIAPPPPPRPRRAVAVLAAGLVAGMALALWLAIPAAPPPPAVASRVEGVVLLDGAALVAGSAVRAGALTVPAGTRLRLSWSAGGGMVLSGPASAVIGGDQCALAAGSATASGPMLVALPDGALTLAAGDRAAIQVEDGAAVVAALAGAPLLAPGGAAATAIAVGTARGATGSWAWPEGTAPWWSIWLAPAEPPAIRRTIWPDAILSHAHGRLRGEGRLTGLDCDIPWSVQLELRRRPGHLEILADGASLGRWPGAWPAPDCTPAAAPVPAPRPPPTGWEP